MGLNEEIGNRLDVHFGKRGGRGLLNDYERLTQDRFTVVLMIVPPDARAPTMHDGTTFAACHVTGELMAERNAMLMERIAVRLSRELP